MRDIFSEGLLYLDLLEIYGSTYAVAEICGIAQSNVFRGANACSKLLNLGLSKDKLSGSYRVERNQDVLRDLRRLNQKMRAREHGQLRLTGAESLLFTKDLTLEQSRTHQLLPERWQGTDTSLKYLERSLLDILVIRASNLRSLVSWPPPVRRRDLFVPIVPFAVTELCELPFVLLAMPNHPLSESATPAEISKLNWLVDEALPLDLVREAHPSVSLHVWRNSDMADAITWPRIQSDPSQVWLTNIQNFSALKSRDSSFDLRPLSFEINLKEYLLAVSLPALVAEPVHQSLIRHLRELAGYEKMQIFNTRS